MPMPISVKPTSAVTFTAYMYSYYVSYKNWPFIRSLRKSNFSFTDSQGCKKGVTGPRAQAQPKMVHKKCRNCSKSRPPLSPRTFLPENRFEFNDPDFTRPNIPIISL